MCTHLEPSEKNDFTLKEAQSENKDIQLVRSWVESGKRPFISKIIQQRFVVKSPWNQFDRLCMREGLLMRKWILLPLCKDTFQAIIPERWKELEMCHDSQSLGHLGVTKTLAKIKQNYY